MIQGITDTILSEEQAQTITFWYMMNGAQQIVGGLLAYCFTLITSGPLLSWQAIFITYGCFSVLFGVFVLWWLPDSPMRAKCFSESDKTLMVERVRSNQTGLQNKKFRSYQVWVREPLKEGDLSHVVTAWLDSETLANHFTFLVAGCLHRRSNMVLLLNPDMHHAAYEWVRSICKSHYYRLRLFDPADSTPSHGSGRLHHIDPIEQHLAGQKDRTESVGHGYIRNPVSRPNLHPDIRKSR